MWAEEITVNTGKSVAKLHDCIHYADLHITLLLYYIPVKYVQSNRFK